MCVAVEFLSLLMFFCSARFLYSSSLPLFHQPRGQTVAIPADRKKKCVTVSTCYSSIRMAHTSASEPGKFCGFRNRLGLERSPYLLQHANNPVDWYV